MLGWFKRGDVETRAADYTDAVLTLLQQRAAGNVPADVGALGALEACAGEVGRAFAHCDVSAGSPSIMAALTPDLLELVGRSLIRHGELVCYLDTTGGDVRIIPAASHNVAGGPTAWEYDVTLGGPSRTVSYYGIAADSVLHFRYAAHHTTPWRGQGPIEVAALAGRLASETVRSLADESSGPIARIMGIPTDGADPTVTQFKLDIAAARGRLALIETGDWGATNGAVLDLETKRVGPMPPQPLVDLAQQANNEIYAACGFNPALFTAGDAASLRESWRLALFGVIAPLGRKVASELNLKLPSDITLDWQELRASDLSGRARAFQSLVGGGMDIAQAAAVAGVLTPEG